MSQDRAATIAEQQVVGNRPGIVTALTRDLGDAALARRRVVDRVAADVGVLPQGRILVDEREAGVVGILLGEQSRAHGGVLECCIALFKGQLGDCLVAGHEAPRMFTLKSEQYGNRPTGDLRNEAAACARDGVALGELAAPLRRLSVVLQEQEHDWAIGACDDALHHVHVAVEPTRVFAGDAGIDDLKQAMTALLDRTRERDKFVLAGEGAGHRTTIRRDVHGGARSGKADSACLHGGLDQRRHARNIVGGDGFVGGTARAHHVGPQRAVGQKGRHIEGARHRVQRIEILREGFPVPFHARAQRGTGNVLDTFHQTDEEIMIVRRDRREADAAVAHHGSGHTVRKGLGEIDIPAHLTVVVRMDVDPAGCDDQTIGIESACRSPECLADGRYLAVLDRDVRHQ